MPKKNSKSVVEYRNYYLPADFPVLLLTGEKWRISDVLQDNLHFHNCLEVGICHSDSGDLYFHNDQKVPFRAGDITCIPRNIPHTTCSSHSTQSRWSYLFFDPRQLFLNASSTDFHPNINVDLVQADVNNYLIPCGTSPRITFLINVIIEELSQDSPEYILVKSYLFALFSELSRHMLPGSLHQSFNNPITESHVNPAAAEVSSITIAPALSFIEDNYMTKFPVEHLAELCHLSQTHFRRTFQAIMRVSPLTYLNNIRIMNACSLLRNTNHTILSIAETTGFTTLSNFNRHFSQMMGISPRDYRKKMYEDQMSGEKPSIIEYTGWMEPIVEQDPKNHPQ